VLGHEHLMSSPDLQQVHDHKLANIMSFACQ
jgi:hypothetical protein